MNNFQNSEREVVNLLFGVDNEEIFTVQEISEILEINKELVENINSKALLLMNKEIFNNNFKIKNKVNKSNQQKENKFTKDKNISRDYDQKKEEKNKLKTLVY